MAKERDATLLISFILILACLVGCIECGSIGRGAYVKGVSFISAYLQCSETAKLAKQSIRLFSIFLYTGYGHNQRLKTICMSFKVLVVTLEIPRRREASKLPR